MNSRVYPEIFPGIAAIRIVVAISIIVAITAVLASWKYDLPLLDTAAFSGWVIVVFYIPGDLINRWCRLYEGTKLSSTLNFVVSVAVGLCSMTVVYELVRKFEIPISFVQSGLLACGVIWIVLISNRALSGDKYQAPELTSDRNESSAIMIVVAALILMLSVSHYRDIVIAESGIKYSLTSFNETSFHEGLINALAVSYPPGPLYKSGGIDFSFYHLGLHLQIDLLHRLSGIDAAKLIYFYFSTLYFLLISLLCFAVARALGGNNRVAAVTGLLVFASDFSYLPAIAAGEAAPALWIQLHIPVIYSLFTFNGMLPGLVALFCFILYFLQFSRTTGFRLLIVLSCIAYSAYLTKSSMGLQILAISILVCSFAAVKQPRKWWLGASVSFTVILFLMIYKQGMQEHSLGGAVLLVQPFNVFKQVLSNYGLQNIDWYLFVPAYFVFVALTIGPRYLGYRVFSDFGQGFSGERWTFVFIGLFVVSGFVLSDTIFIGYPNRVDNSIWFAVQSLLAAWLLVSIYLIGKTKEHELINWILPLAILAISMPSTIQFLIARSGAGEADHYFTMGMSEWDMVEELRSIDIDAVILHPVNFESPSLVSNFSGHVSVFNGFRSFVHIDDAVRIRITDIDAFFSKSPDNQLMTEVIDRYDVSHVLCAVDACGSAIAHPDLQVVHKNADYRLFRVDVNGNHR